LSVRQRWGDLACVFRFTPPLRRLALVTLGFSLLVTATEAGTFGLIYTLLKQAMEGRHEQLGAMVALVVGASLVRTAAGFLAAHSSATLENRLMVDVRERIFDRLQGVAIAYHDRTPTGTTMHALSGETITVKWVVSAVATTTSQGAMLGVYGLLLAAVSWRLALVTAMILGALAGLNQLWSPRVVARSRAHAQAHGAFIVGASEWLRGIRTVHAFAAAAFERERYAARARDIADAAIALADLHAVRVALGEGLGLGVLAGILLIGLVAFDLPLVAVVGFQLVLLRAIWAFKNVNGALGILVVNQGVIANIARLLRLDDKPVIEDGTRGYAGLGSGIVFEDVWFAYEPQTPVLRGLDLVLPTNTFTAVVGASGAGKSTLAHLLLRFYQPDAGRILIDGQDLRELSIDGMRRRVALVSQDTFLFDVSIRENIAYGIPAADDAAVREAAARAGALEFIEAFPDGLDTVVGERGVRLSAGQGQRIAIARALLRAPDLLILDEATSALDNVSERLIQSSIEQLASGRTVLAIAHRLSTIARADRIVVLDEGRVVEQGTFAELSARGGAFSRFLSAAATPQAAGT
jgi:ABC-type multidrug transport system fused ATPase/permease subunit